MSAIGARTNVMKLQEIPQSRWCEFLDQFSRLHHGQELEVSTSGPGAPASHRQARHLPLLGITNQPPDALRPASIDISAADPSGSHIHHAIKNPTRIRAAEWNDAVSARLEIESPEGITTLQIGPAEQVLPPGVILDGYVPR
jgi:hypothetical protein